MDIKDGYIDCINRSRKENYIIRFADPMLYDRLHTLSAEYSLSVDTIVNIAVKRLIDDVDFVRNIRLGKLD